MSEYRRPIPPNDAGAIAKLQKKVNDKRKLSKILRPTATGEYDVSKCETLFCHVADITITPINYVDGQYFKVVNRSAGEVHFDAWVDFRGLIFAAPVSLAAGEALTVIYDASDNIFVCTSLLSESVSGASPNNTPE